MRIKIKSLNKCWPWKGAKISFGHGQLTFARRRYIASRMIWTLFHGHIPAGMCVLHSCDNPGCCNPRHLFLGTKYDNTRDMLTKGRHGNQKKHCLRGHPFNKENTYLNPKGYRTCRTCQRKRSRKWAKKNPR